MNPILYVICCLNVFNCEPCSLLLFIFLSFLFFLVFFLFCFVLLFCVQVYCVICIILFFVWPFLFYLLVNCFAVLNCHLGEMKILYFCVVKICQFEIKFCSTYYISKSNLMLNLSDDYMTFPEMGKKNMVSRWDDHRNWMDLMPSGSIHVPWTRSSIFIFIFADNGFWFKYYCFCGILSLMDMSFRSS